ncbi:hypothetical protein GBA52_001643 [Prunus armeniaca]|nr:hypothetical protein GBA52_001643 [Prunus armeniaca]
MPVPVIEPVFKFGFPAPRGRHTRPLPMLVAVSLVRPRAHAFPQCASHRLPLPQTPSHSDHLRAAPDSTPASISGTSDPTRTWSSMGRASPVSSRNTAVATKSTSNVASEAIMAKKPENGNLAHGNSGKHGLFNASDPPLSMCTNPVARMTPAAKALAATKRLLSVRRNRRFFSYEGNGYPDDSGDENRNDGDEFEDERR